MIAGIIRWSLKNRLFVVVGSLLLLLWGGYEATRMPVDVFPDLTAPTVTVVVEAHGMAPQEVESLVTFPIETALNGASGVRRVRSTTGVGIAVIWVEFDWGTDIYLARQIVAEKLQLVRGALPPEIPPPILAPVSSIMGEILFIALTSDRHGEMELKTTADWTLRRRLLAVPGVAEVISTGGEIKQYQVVLKPARLAAYGIATDEVIEALSRSNENISAGFYAEGGQEYLIHGLGRVQSPADIGDTLVAMRGGDPVLVKHIAEVRIGPALKRGAGAANGRPAVVIGIQKQPTANTLSLTRDIDAVLDEIQAALPEGMHIETHVFRQADFIELAIDNLVHALRDGAVLVVLIVFAFLVNLRATLITLIAIPLSLVTALLAMSALGATINTMTLGGMAIAIGALVDDAIIDVENVVRRLRERRELPGGRASPGRCATVYDATREIQGSIVFATLIIMLVFLPLFFLSGVEGRLLAPLGFAYVVSLAASLLVAVTVTPVLCSLLLPGSKVVREGREGLLARLLKALYRPVLGLTVRRWLLVSLVAGIGFGVAVVYLLSAGRSFLPDFNEGSLTISAVTLPGTSLEESDELGRMVENILLQQPEVVATARRTGRAELDEHAQDVHASEIEVRLQMGERSKEELLAALRESLTAVPGTNIVIGQPISHRIDHMLSGTRANIAVKIFGPDLYELRRIAGQIETLVRTVPGAVDVAVEQQADIPFLTVELERAAIARHGLSVRDLGGGDRDGLRRARGLPGAGGRDDLRSGRALRPGQQRRPRGHPLHPGDHGHRRAAAAARAGGHPQGSWAEHHRPRERAAQDRGHGQRGRPRPARGRRRHPPGDRQGGAAAGRLPHRVRRSVRERGAGLAHPVAPWRRRDLGIFLLLFVAFRSARDALLVMLNLPLALIGGVMGVFAPVACSRWRRSSASSPCSASPPATASC